MPAATAAQISEIQDLVGVIRTGVWGGVTFKGVLNRLHMNPNSSMRDLQRRVGSSPDGVFGFDTAEEILEDLRPGSPLSPVLRGNDPVNLITVALLRQVAAADALTQLPDWIEPLKKAATRANIRTTRRLAVWIAQMAHESGLKPRMENLNYSVEGLMKTFGRHRISEADCKRLGRSGNRPADQQAIANTIYGGEWGRKNLGNTLPGDGWLCRGSGPLQATGRANYTRFAEYMGLSFEEAVAYARTLEGGIMFAAWFWEENDINRLADTDRMDDERKAVNGGTLGLADTIKKTNTLIAAFRAAGAA